MSKTLSAEAEHKPYFTTKRMALIGVMTADLDEDEMAAFLSNQRFVCPYYQTDEEYKIVRKQM